MTALDRTFTATLQKSPSKGGWTHKLAVPAGVRTQIGKQAGDAVTVHLDERLSPTSRRTAR